MQDLITLYIPGAFSIFCLIAFYGLAKQNIAGQIVVDNRQPSVSSSMASVLWSSFVAAFIPVKHMVIMLEEYSEEAVLEEFKKHIESLVKKANEEGNKDEEC